MICYVCSINATHRIYGDLKPVCGKHFIEAVCEEDGDILVSMIDTTPATCNRTVNDARIEEIKVELNLVKAKKDVLNDLTLAVIGKIDAPVMNTINAIQYGLTAQQDALFTEWKRLSEENYQAFQKWFDGLGMGVNK